MKCDKVNKNLVFPAIFLCMLLIGSCAPIQKKAIYPLPVSGNHPPVRVVTYGDSSTIVDEATANYQELYKKTGDSTRRSYYFWIYQPSAESVDRALCSENYYLITGLPNFNRTWYFRMIDGYLTNQYFDIASLETEDYNYLDTDGQMKTGTARTIRNSLLKPALSFSAEDIEQIRKWEKLGKKEITEFPDFPLEEGEEIVRHYKERYAYCKLADGIHKMLMHGCEVLVPGDWKGERKEPFPRWYWMDVYTGELYDMQDVLSWPITDSGLHSSEEAKEELDGWTFENRENFSYHEENFASVYSRIPTTEELVENYERQMGSFLTREAMEAEKEKNPYCKWLPCIGYNLSEQDFGLVRMIDGMKTNQVYCPFLNRNVVKYTVKNPITIRDDQIEEYRKSVEGKTALTQYDAPEPYFGEEPLQEKKRETVVFLLKDGLHQLEQITYTVLGAGTLTFEDGTTGKYRGEVTYWYDAFTGRQLSENEIDWWKS